MGTLLLRLAAPLQAWGTDSKYDIRATGREPSKSGVIGLLAAALGVRRDEPEKLLPLCALRFGIRADREGQLLCDLQNAIIHKNANKKDDVTYMTHRYYLSDAVFLVGLESDDDALLSSLDEALRHPVFPLFLGRRSCPPTLPLTLGVRPLSLADALKNEPRLCEGGQNSLRVMTDAEPSAGSRAVRRDVPVSFDSRNRRFRDRAVTELGFFSPVPTPAPASAEKIVSQPQENDDSEHDPMKELR